MNNKKIGVGFGLMLLKDGRVLLGKRHVDPKKADSELREEGSWTMPGGKLDYGESFEEGAKRELQEEIGYRAKSLVPYGFLHSAPGFTNEKVFLFNRGILKS